MVTLFLPQKMLIRVFLGWLRGEPLQCRMMAIPTLEEEDAGGNVAFMPPNGRVWPKPERPFCSMQQLQPDVRSLGNVNGNRPPRSGQS